MSSYNVLLATDEATVVAEYKPEKQNRTEYQTEAELEAAFIKQLESQGYEYLNIHTSDEMIGNLRKKLEELNNYQFSDNEWQTFFKTSIANHGDGIVQKTERIQRDYLQALKRDDGTTENIKLIESFYVLLINQLKLFMLLVDMRI